jgi:hypothetical protein
MGLGDLTQTLASVAFLKDSSPVDVERRAADMPAFQPGAAHSGPYPLSKHSDQTFWNICVRSGENECQNIS